MTQLWWYSIRSLPHLGKLVRGFKSSSNETKIKNLYILKAGFEEKAEGLRFG